MAFRPVTLTTAERFAEAAALYRAVFGYQDPEYALNPRLLGALVSNGGSVVGVLDEDDRLVAFAYGFCGTDRRGFYHYSQSAVVAADQQGHGLGRLLKHAQREVALSHGMTRMRWTYDPFQIRNGHFNLDVLGARGRWYAPDMYGPGGDRVVVEWNLHAQPRAQDHLELELTEADWGVLGGAGDRPWLALPSDPAAVTPEIAERVRQGFLDLLGKGLAADSCRRLPNRTAVYLFGAADDGRS
ncbi:GNAT family N-acetyltransferase [Kribbella sp. NPDC050820]|uniref:GNAT family N-acetyltransferase n=1 Tax=Kribbella sp. NPDC050820 TaxID=3155408 RepID=UPI0033D68314